MTPERDQLEERYLEAQLRDELGPPVDLSERVLRSVYGKPRRVVPPPRRIPAWRPLAAAAAVLIAAGLATYTLVQVLPEREQPLREGAQSVPYKVETGAPPSAPQQQPEAAPQPEPRPQPEAQPQPEPKEEPKPDEQVEKPTPEPEEEDKSVIDVTPKPPEDQVEDPSDNDSPHPDKGWTDPPDAWPDPKKKYDDPRKDAPVLVSAWKGESLKVRHAGQDGRVIEQKLKQGEAFGNPRRRPRGAQGPRRLHPGRRHAGATRRRADLWRRSFGVEADTA
ncbi:MAG: hypothetical protein M5U25_15590 [Planctomycetota bacterium]|nr:hypothetical protein [Planctomycetota bacterium]